MKDAYLWFLTFYATGISAYAWFGSLRLARLAFKRGWADGYKQSAVDFATGLGNIKTGPKAWERITEQLNAKWEKQK